MNKFLFAISALALCACSAHQQPVPAASAPVSTPVAVEIKPVDVELANSGKAQALPCTDGFDCLKKLTGLCANGYEGGQRLQGENGRVVGVLFHCITDEEIQEQKAEEARRAQEEAAWRAERLAEAKAAAEAAAAQKKTPAKK